MSDVDDKILKTLGDIQSDVSTIKDVQQKQGKRLEALEVGQNALQADVSTIKDVQLKQGKRLETLETGQQTLELKVEAVHAYQKQAHDEIMGHLVDITEIEGREQKILEKRIERIEKHLGLPPLK